MSVLEAVPTTTEPSARRLMGTAFALENVSTADEALKTAGLDWEPVHRSLFAQPVDVDIADLDFDSLDFVEKERSVRRSDTGEMFGVVGREHKLLSNADMFAFADSVIDEAGTTWLDCEPVGGSLGGGRQPFLAIQLGEGVQVAGQDAVNCALLLSNGHVGNTAFTGTVTPLRVSCSNVVRANIGKGLMSFTIQHSGNLEGKVADAKDALAITSAYMAEFANLADRMAAVDMSLTEFDDFLTDLIPLKPDAGDRAKKTVEDTRATFRRNWKDTLTLTDDLKTTRWGALNIITEVIDWGNLDVRKSKVPVNERRVRSVHFGTGANLRDRAYTLLGV